MKYVVNIGLGLIVAAVLAALLFPAVSVRMDAGPRAQGKNDVTQIAMAVIAYETEYGHLPVTNESFRLVDGELLAALMGSTAGGLNPRSLVFLEVGTAKKGKSGLFNGAFVDSFGVPSDRFRWKFRREGGCRNKSRNGSQKGGRVVESRRTGGMR